MLLYEEAMPQDTQLSRQRFIGEGDSVIVYERPDTMKAAVVTATGSFDNRFDHFVMKVIFNPQADCLGRSNKHRSQEDTHPLKPRSAPRISVHQPFTRHGVTRHVNKASACCPSAAESSSNFTTAKRSVASTHPQSCCCQ